MLRGPVCRRLSALSIVCVALLGGVSLSLSRSTSWAGAAPPSASRPAVSAVVGPSDLDPPRYDQPTGVDCPSAGWCVALDGDTYHLQLQVLSHGVWSARAVPGSGSGTPLLVDVDCPAVRQCVAVGQVASSTGPRAGVVVLDGGGLTTETLPEFPRLGDSSGLSAVSCAALDYCVASGYTSTSPDALLWQRTSTGWQNALPSGPALDSITAVSCAPAVCLAVATSAGRQVVLVRSGDTWTTTTPPATAGTLTAVDCYGAQACLATGTTAGGAARAARFESGAWTTARIPAAPGVSSTRFDRVDCATDGRCVAAGPSYAATITQDAAHTVALPVPAGRSVEFLSCGAWNSCQVGGTYAPGGTNAQWVARLDGGVWTRYRVPLPAEVGTVTSSMFGLSCAGAGFCVVQGAAFRTDNTRVDTLASYSAPPARFAVSRSPAPRDAAPNASTVLSDVACRDGGACLAVGSYVRAGGARAALFVERDAAGETARRAPVPADAGTGPAALTAVTCASTDACVAVGHYRDSSGATAGLIETRVDGAWQAIRAPGPVVGAPTRVELTDVSCAGFCTAIGSAVVDGVESGLILTDRGGALKAESADLPAGQRLATLQTVACTVAGACTAIGTAADGRAVFLYSASGPWKGIYLAAPSGEDAATIVTDGALSCSSDGNCSVVGVYRTFAGEYRLVADDIDAGVLTATDLPFPVDGADLTGAHVSALSCASDGNCVGAGDGPGTGPFVLRRTAGDWAVTAAPLPARAQPAGAATLSAVSCATADRCVATGGYAVAAGERPLVLSLDGGAWSASGLPLAPGVRGPADESLDAVSCVGSVCLAVGGYDGASGTGAVLAYRRG